MFRPRPIEKVAVDVVLEVSSTFRANLGEFHLPLLNDLRKKDIKEHWGHTTTLTQAILYVNPLCVAVSNTHLCSHILVEGCDNGHQRWWDA